MNSTIMCTVHKIPFPHTQTHFMSSPYDDLPRFTQTGQDNTRTITLLLDIGWFVMFFFLIRTPSEMPADYTIKL